MSSAKQYRLMCNQSSVIDISTSTINSAPLYNIDICILDRLERVGNCTSRPCFGPKVNGIHIKFDYCLHARTDKLSCIQKYSEPLNRVKNIEIFCYRVDKCTILGIMGIPI